MKVTLAILDLKAGWRVLSLPTASLLGEAPAGEDTRSFDVDLFAGGRYWYVKNELDLKVPVTLSAGLPPGTPLPPGLGDLELPSLTTDGIDRDIDADADWIDPWWACGSDRRYRGAVAVGARRHGRSTSARPRSSAGRRMRC